VNGSDATTASVTASMSSTRDRQQRVRCRGWRIALQDAVDVRIVNNTITRNDSVATGSRAFGASVSQSVPQPGAGVAARTHSPALLAIVGR